MRRSKKTYNTEVLIRNTFRTLTRDLAIDPLLLDQAVHVSQNPHGSLPWTCSGTAWHTKYMIQIRDFFKRWILSTDLSPEELATKSLVDFITSQEGYGVKTFSKASLLVLGEARSIVGDILGDFDLDVFSSFCAYGKRAARGLKRKDSYLDVRIGNLTCTQQQLALYNEVRRRDVRLLRATRQKHRRSVKIVDSVKMTAVAKSFKAARIIAPDTVIGGFLSRGLGSYMRDRLEATTHIDLAKQPARHQNWAREASVTGHLATLDMSKASDSFVWQHIELLLPESWLGVMSVMNTPFVEVLGKCVELKSYMLMGSGHTFPLQTILFYALCEATRRLLKARGKVSVFGDDLIVPTSTSGPLKSILSDLGFTVNVEKSFCDAPDHLWKSKPFFRESCGGDFFGGCNVRPYMPQGVSSDVAPHEYLALIHKLFNGLHSHFSAEEIYNTHVYLLSEIERVNGTVNAVPACEGEASGIFIDSIMMSDHAQFSISSPKISVNTWCLTYYKLVEKRPDRTVQDEHVYYWYHLYGKQHTRSDVFSDNDLPASAGVASPVRLEKDKDVEKMSYRWVNA